MIIQEDYSNDHCYCTCADGSALLIQAQPERVLICSLAVQPPTIGVGRAVQRGGKLMIYWQVGTAREFLSWNSFLFFATMKVNNLLDNSHMFLQELPAIPVFSQLLLKHAMATPVTTN